MITIKNHVGKITITQEYLTTLIGSTVTSCFGVVSMNVNSPKQTLKTAFLRDGNKSLDRGVSVRVSKDKLVIDLHISLMYGVNMNTVVRSIIHKVSYVIEESTGISVEKVNVYVDGIRI
jgi:uncharacterized alkaline shock family protein YloU